MTTYLCNYSFDQSRAEHLDSLHGQGGMNGTGTSGAEMEGIVDTSHKT